MRNCLFLFLCLVAFTGCVTPSHVYLTWQGDTSTTMTVNFHTMERAASRVHFDTEPHEGKISEYAGSVKGTSRQIPGLADKRWIHTVELTDLTPGGTYYFAVDEGPKGVVKERKFQTLPNDGSPIRFIDGGDVGPLPAARNLLQHAAALSPHFIEIGGDIAYENGNIGQAGVYDAWLSRWVECLVTPEGYTIPGILAIGNHECNKVATIPAEKAPFYFGYFAQGGQSNFVRKLGSLGVLIALDSDHILSHESQVGWLRDTLEAHANTPYKFATYHVPLYPSHRDADGSGSDEGRKHWQPLFDEFDLTVGLEHHDHTFKRSKLIRNNAVDPTGTLYLGDGCMGQSARSVDIAPRWYLEKASSTRHFWFIELTKEGVKCDAIDVDGKVFDTVTLKP